MKYYLDTNIIIYYIKGLYPGIKDNIIKVPAQSIVIPAIVKAEIEYGARKTVDYNKTIHNYNKFLDIFTIEPFDDECVTEYGIIRSELEKSGQIIGSNDLIIAATVKSKNGTLITHNTREFSRINGLTLADWTE